MYKMCINIIMLFLLIAWGDPVQTSRSSTYNRITGQPVWTWYKGPTSVWTTASHKCCPSGRTGSLGLLRLNILWTRKSEHRSKRTIFGGHVISHTERKTWNWELYVRYVSSSDYIINMFTKMCSIVCINCNNFMNNFL